jgi:hypothetical protein
MCSKIITCLNCVFKWSLPELNPEGSKKKNHDLKSKSLFDLDGLQRTGRNAVSLNHCYIQCHWTIVTSSVIEPLLHPESLNHCYIQCHWTIVTSSVIEPLLYPVSLNHCYIQCHWTIVTYSVIEPLLHPVSLNHCYIQYHWTIVTSSIITAIDTSSYYFFISCRSASNKMSGDGLEYVRK